MNAYSDLSCILYGNVEAELGVASILQLLACTNRRRLVQVTVERALLFRLPRHLSSCIGP